MRLTRKCVAQCAFSFDSAGISAQRNSIPQRGFTRLRLPAASAIRP